MSILPGCRGCSPRGSWDGPARWSCTDTCRTLVRPNHDCHSFIERGSDKESTKSISTNSGHCSQKSILYRRIQYVNELFSYIDTIQLSSNLGYDSIVTYFLDLGSLKDKKPFFKDMNEIYDSKKNCRFFYDIRCLWSGFENVLGVYTIRMLNLRNKTNIYNIM